MVVNRRRRFWRSGRRETEQNAQNARLFGASLRYPKSRARRSVNRECDAMRGIFPSFAQQPTTDVKNVKDLNRDLDQSKQNKQRLQFIQFIYVNSIYIYF